MLPKMLLCIHPTGVPSNKLPLSIWLLWAFFHYPRVCLLSHVGKLHLYLCQWEKFPSGNISRNQGKDLSNLLRSKEVTAGFPLSRLLFPNSSQKMSCFLSERLSHHPPLPAQGKSLDSPQAHGAAHDQQACILGHWGPSTPQLTEIKRRAGENGPLTPLGYCTKGLSGKQLWVFCYCCCCLNLFVLPSTSEGHNCRQVLTSKAVVNMPLWTGEALLLGVG